jgi:hypothetical protein
MDMAPIFARKVIGDSYIDRYPQMKPAKPTYAMEWRAPSWDDSNPSDS